MLNGIFIQLGCLPLVVAAKNIVQMECELVIISIIIIINIIQKFILIDRNSIKYEFNYIINMVNNNIL
jgi:hypothetical protein